MQDKILLFYPYFIEDRQGKTHNPKLLVKIPYIKQNETIKIVVKKREGFKPDQEQTFLFFDDFTSEDTLDDIWNIYNSSQQNISFEDETSLKINTSSQSSPITFVSRKPIVYDQDKNLGFEIVQQVKITSNTEEDSFIQIPILQLKQDDESSNPYQQNLQNIQFDNQNVKFNVQSTVKQSQSIQQDKYYYSKLTFIPSNNVKQFVYNPVDQITLINNVSQNLTDNYTYQKLKVQFQLPPYQEQIIDYLYVKPKLSQDLEISLYSSSQQDNSQTIQITNPNNFNIENYVIEIPFELLQDVNITDENKSLQIYDINYTGILDDTYSMMYTISGLVESNEIFQENGYTLKLRINRDLLFDFIPYINSDYSNVKFYMQQEQVLNYWIEHDENGNVLENGYLWIRVNRIPQGGSRKIKIKLNQESQYEQNGDKVFDLFDDFDGEELDTEKWEYTLNVVSPLLQNSCLKVKDTKFNIRNKIDLFKFPFFLKIYFKRLQKSNQNDERYFGFFFSNLENYQQQYISIPYKYPSSNTIGWYLHIYVSHFSYWIVKLDYTYNNHRYQEILTKTEKQVYPQDTPQIIETFFEQNQYEFQIKRKNNTLYYNFIKDLNLNYSSLYFYIIQNGYQGNSQSYQEIDWIQILNNITFENYSYSISQISQNEYEITITNNDTENNIVDQQIPISIQDLKNQGLDLYNIQPNHKQQNLSLEIVEIYEDNEVQSPLYWWIEEDENGNVLTIKDENGNDTGDQYIYIRLPFIGKNDLRIIMTFNPDTTDGLNYRNISETFQDIVGDNFDGTELDTNKWEIERKDQGDLLDLQDGKLRQYSGYGQVQLSVKNSLIKDENLQFEVNMLQMQENNNQFFQLINLSSDGQINISNEWQLISNGYEWGLNQFSSKSTIIQKVVNGSWTTLLNTTDFQPQNNIQYKVQYLFNPKEEKLQLNINDQLYTQQVNDNTFHSFSLLVFKPQQSGVYQDYYWFIQRYVDPNKDPTIINKQQYGSKVQEKISVEQDFQSTIQKDNISISLNNVEFYKQYEFNISNTFDVYYSKIYEEHQNFDVVQLNIYNTPYFIERTVTLKPYKYLWVMIHKLPQNGEVRLKIKKDNRYKPDPYRTFLFFRQQKDQKGNSLSSIFNTNEYYSQKENYVKFFNENLSDKNEINQYQLYDLKNIQKTQVEHNEVIYYEKNEDVFDFYFFFEGLINENEQNKFNQYEQIKEEQYKGFQIDTNQYLDDEGLQLTIKHDPHQYNYLFQNKSWNFYSFNVEINEEQYGEYKIKYKQLIQLDFNNSIFNYEFYYDVQKNYNNSIEVFQSTYVPFNKIFLEVNDNKVIISNKYYFDQNSFELVPITSNQQQFDQVYIINKEEIQKYNYKLFELIKDYKQKGYFEDNKKYQLLLNFKEKIEIDDTNGYQQTSENRLLNFSLQIIQNGNVLIHQPSYWLIPTQNNKLQFYGIYFGHKSQGNPIIITDCQQNIQVKFHTCIFNTPNVLQWQRSYGTLYVKYEKVHYLVKNGGYYGYIVNGTITSSSQYDQYSWYTDTYGTCVSSVQTYSWVHTVHQMYNFYDILLQQDPFNFILYKLKFNRKQLIDYIRLRTQFDYNDFEFEKVYQDQQNEYVEVVIRNKNQERGYKNISIPIPFEYINPEIRITSQDEGLKIIREGYVEEPQYIDVRQIKYDQQNKVEQLDLMIQRYINQNTEEQTFDVLSNRVVTNENDFDIQKKKQNVITEQQSFDVFQQLDRIIITDLNDDLIIKKELDLNFVQQNKFKVSINDQLIKHFIIKIQLEDYNNKEVILEDQINNENGYIEKDKYYEIDQITYKKKIILYLLQPDFNWKQKIIDFINNFGINTQIDTKEDQQEYVNDQDTYLLQKSQIYELWKNGMIQQSNISLIFDDENKEVRLDLSQWIGSSSQKELTITFPFVHYEDLYRLNIIIDSFYNQIWEQIQKSSNYPILNRNNLEIKLLYDYSSDVYTISKEYHIQDQDITFFTCSSVNSLQQNSTLEELQQQQSILYQTTTTVDLIVRPKLYIKLNI